MVELLVLEVVPWMKLDRGPPKAAHVDNFILGVWGQQSYPLPNISKQYSILLSNRPSSPHYVLLVCHFFFLYLGWGWQRRRFIPILSIRST